MISFVVPAHNEEACIVRTVEAIHQSARAFGQPHEVIVVNDASTDATAKLAEQNNARVVSVNHRQIAATRNSGARAALGDRIFFVDADTTINPRAVAQAMRCMDRGAVGGGALVKIEGDVPLYASILSIVAMLPAKMIGFCGGAFMFCTREAFHKSGGFNEKFFWAEEGTFAMALKRLGPFVVIWNRIQTSGRRFNTTNGFQLFATMLRVVFRPAKAFTSRKSVEKIWYDSNRSNDDKPKRSFGAKAMNSLLLILLLMALMGPIWRFVPWSATPLGTPLGIFRFIDATLLCHGGLLLWPVAFLLLWNLIRQKWTREWFRSAAVATFFLWQAWRSTVGVITVWILSPGFYSLTNHSAPVHSPALPGTQETPSPPQ